MSIAASEEPHAAATHARHSRAGGNPAPFARYPNYKDSGVAWLGEVPAHWGVVALKRIAHMRSGDGISSDEISEAGDYPVYGGNGLRGFTSGYTHEGVYPIIGRQGALCGNINYSEGRFWASEHAIVVSPLPGVDTKWLGETLRGMNLNQYSVSAAQPGLAVEVIKALRLAVPPPAEQLAIAAFLDRETAKIDALIVEQEKLIALLREKRQALISHAVTKGLDPNAPMKGSGIEWLGQVPAHWGVVRLKFLARVQTGVAKGKDYASAATVTLPYLRVANVQDGHIDLTDVAEIEVAESEADRYQLQPGDVLMNEGGDYDKLGRGAIWRGQINPCIHQNHVFAVRPHSVSSDWLNLITSADYAQFFFMGQSKQSTNLASISSTNLMELPVVLPPPADVDAIVTYVTRQVHAADDLVARALHAIGLLKERRAALISAAVTGKIDVRGFAASCAPATQ